MPRRPGDVALHVKFETRPILNEAKSYGAKIRDNENKIIEEIKGEGRPIYDLVDYVTIQPLADKTTVVDRPVECCDKALLEPNAKFHLNCRARRGMDDKPMLEECDPHRFPDEWQAFKSGKEDQTQGTPLRTWAAIDRASVEELAYFKVTTIEQLAELNDSNATKFFHLRERARDHIKQSRQAISNESLAERIKQLEAQNAALQAAAKEKPLQPRKV